VESQVARAGAPTGAQRRRRRWPREHSPASTTVAAAMGEGGITTTRWEARYPVVPARRSASYWRHAVPTNSCLRFP